MNPSKDVAVIVVHGVADQQPGETARALVDLLVSACPEDVRYTAGAAEKLTIPVEPLLPRDAGCRGRTAAPTPLSEDRPLAKSLAQSWRSDIQAAQATTPSARKDDGLEMTNFLLWKHFDNGGVRESYTCERIALGSKVQGQPGPTVDVYEMYWADLSRLSGQVPRIVEEVFTLVFRLSRLGRDTVGLAQKHRREQRGADTRPGITDAAWWLTAHLQRLLDWVIVQGLGLLLLQLLALGLLVLAIGGMGAAAAGAANAWLKLLLDGLPLLLSAGGGFLLWYRWPGATPRSLALPAALLLAAPVAWGIARAETPWITFIALIAVVTLLLDKGLRVADDRFPFVRWPGLAMWALAVACVLGRAWASCHGPAGACGAPDLAPALELWDIGAAASLPRLAEAWLAGPLLAVEWTLLLIKHTWIVAAALLAAWLLAGVAATLRGDHADRATVATGRLGVTLSYGALVALTMALWGLLQLGLEQAVGSMHYRPQVFTAGTEDMLAREFLAGRFANSTTGFVLVAGVLAILVFYLVVAMLPSILAELKVLVDRRRQAVKQTASHRSAASPTPPAADPPVAGDNRRARQLGLWLTRGYRWLDAVTLLLAVAGVVSALLVAATFLQWPSPEAAAVVDKALREQSARLLAPLAISATGLLAFLVAFGGLLSKYLPAVRAPLDVALDVDNHFREFPRHAIPRARIFARYAALLGRISEAGYRRLVIVAHSQGTVISTELLRFLCSNGLAPPQEGDEPLLDNGRRLPPVRLLTLGSPLRQLYAARFPQLYRWILRKEQRVCGPTHHDVGAERWFNAFCSGDYVGRWLWSDHDEATLACAQPTSDGSDGALRFGRGDAYAAIVLPPSALQAPLLRDARCVETCLGVGAHTHYFEPDQQQVAWLADYLIREESPADKADTTKPVTASTEAT
ncbi:MAG: hypothetical protein AB1430_23865 [Pseudomonadota bacterium]